MLGYTRTRLVETGRLMRLQRVANDVLPPRTHVPMQIVRDAYGNAVPHVYQLQMPLKLCYLAIVLGVMVVSIPNLTSEPREHLRVY